MFEDGANSKVTIPSSLLSIRGYGMKELLYFSSSDLMVQVNYRETVNAINYHSHRKLSFGERVVVEQYLLTNIAVKTAYYKKCPAVLNYVGINSRLVKDLNQFHLKNTMNSLKEKERVVKSTVRGLIDQSMSSYYFEQIGNTILQIRAAVDKPLRKLDIFEYGNKLRELIDAYNAHVDRHVTFDDVVPVELRTYFDQLGN